MTEVFAATRFSGRLAPGGFDFERDARAAIEAYWRQARKQKPDMFDGRVLLAERAEMHDGRLEAVFRETGFSAFLWLRGGGDTGQSVLNVFGAAAVVSSDGAVLLGRMAQNTSNAGQVYFPAGTPDLGDVFGEKVDLEGSIARELEEETGLAEPTVRAAERRIVVFSGGLVACIRRFDTELDADALQAHVGAHLARDKKPELDALVLARSAAELTEASPPYVHAALPHLLQDLKQRP